jgi:hypothetical protein
MAGLRCIDLWQATSDVWLASIQCILDLYPCILDPASCIKYQASRIQLPMNKYVFILIVGFGLADLLYGIYSHDRVSLVVGPAIIAITAYIAWSKKKR